MHKSSAQGYLEQYWVSDGSLIWSQNAAATKKSRKPCLIYPEKLPKPLFLSGGLVGQVYSLLIIVAVGVGPTLQMH